MSNGSGGDGTGGDGTAGNDGQAGIAAAVAAAAAAAGYGVGTPGTMGAANGYGMGMANGIAAAPPGTSGTVGFGSGIGGTNAGSADGGIGSVSGVSGDPSAGSLGGISVAGVNAPGPSTGGSTGLGGLGGFGGGGGSSGGSPGASSGQGGGPATGVAGGGSGKNTLRAGGQGPPSDVQYNSVLQQDQVTRLAEHLGMNAVALQNVNVVEALKSLVGVLSSPNVNSAQASNDVAIARHAAAVANTQHAQAQNPQSPNSQQIAQLNALLAQQQAQKYGKLGYPGVGQPSGFGPGTATSPQGFPDISVASLFGNQATTPAQQQDVAKLAQQVAQLQSQKRAALASNPALAAQGFNTSPSQAVVAQLAQNLGLGNVYKNAAYGNARSHS